MQNVHCHVWDLHKHFPTRETTNTIARGQPVNLDIKMDDLLVDAAPFEKVVIFGLKARRTNRWVPDEYVAQCVAQAPEKLVGFAACDPTQPGYMEELRFAIEKLGLKGVKMGPIYAGFDPRDPRCMPVYSYCQENGIPILFHTGTTFVQNAPLGYSRPWLFDEVAIRFPGLHMVLAHVGHPFCDECLVVIRKHPHVYADISALFYRPWQFYNMLISAQEYKVTHKLLFGTD
ncbi:MAG: amidohydrolase, partial [Anaerolineae bacterium]|nr:amidohydrolase [Anaerolineae bacterium]